MATQWDLWVEYHRTDGDGLTHTRLKDVERPLELRPGMFVVVGNEEPDPAVAEVVAVEPDGLVLVRVLPGPVGDHLEWSRIVAPLRVEVWAWPFTDR